MKASDPGKLRVIDAATVVLTMLVAAIVEKFDGRSIFCRCGSVRLWAGVVQSPENSQQFADWYSLSHVVHGLLFYGATHLAIPHRRLGIRLMIATSIEAAWEMAENSAYIIARYRAETLSWGYSGDSIFNSMGDILFMLLGFAIASRLRALYSVFIGLALELVSLMAIHDNLTLNVLMLIHPIAAVRAWQGN